MRPIWVMILNFGGKYITMRSRILPAETGNQREPSYSFPRDRENIGYRAEE